LACRLSAFARIGNIVGSREGEAMAGGKIVAVSEEMVS